MMEEIIVVSVGMKILISVMRRRGIDRIICPGRLIIIYIGDKHSVIGQHKVPALPLAILDEIIL